MSDETYQGWTNRETWTVNLWLSNEEPLYLETARIIQQARADALEDLTDLAEEHDWQNTSDEQKTYANGKAGEKLSEYVQELIQQEYPNYGGTMLTDLINCAVGRVDWAEIAQSFDE